MAEPSSHSKMFKRLRNQMLLSNMVILSLVMLAAFATIYLLTYSYIQYDNDRRLRELAPMAIGQRALASDEPGLFEQFWQEPGSGGSSGSPGLPPTISITRTPSMDPSHVLSLIMTADGDGHLLSVMSTLDYQEEDYLKLFAEVDGSQATHGRVRFQGRTWQYLVTAATVSQPWPDGPLIIAPTEPLAGQGGGTGASAQDGSGASAAGAVGRDGTVTSGTVGRDGMSGGGGTGGGTAGGGTSSLASSVNIKQIAFLDVTDSYANLMRMMSTMAVVAVLMLVALWFVSRFLANRSFRPLEESWEKQRQFIADASHELKTPLAIIAANRSALSLDEQSTIASQRKWLDNIDAETRRMNELVNQLLYLSRIEESSSRPLEFDISQMAELALTTMEVMAFEKGIGFVAEIDAGLAARGEEPALRTALLALLDNALKYTPSGGVVRLRLSRERSHIAIRVTNSPAYIPAEKLHRLFDRFYRLDESRSQYSGQDEDGNGLDEGDVEAYAADGNAVADSVGTSSGFGLGLAIARAIAERSGGSLTASADSGGGSQDCGAGGDSGGGHDSGAANGGAGSVSFTLTIPAA